jgi:hypothetical protein
LRAGAARGDAAALGGADGHELSTESRTLTVKEGSSPAPGTAKPALGRQLDDDLAADVVAPRRKALLDEFVGAALDLILGKASRGQ